MNSNEQTPDQKQIDHLNQQLLMVFSQNMQQQRLIWQLVKKLGGSVLIDNEDVSPLWALKFQPVEGRKTMVGIVAEALADLSEDQVNKAIAFLKGTSKSIKEAIDDQGLDLYPTYYLQNRMSHALIWYNEQWMDVVPPDLSKK